MCHIRTCILAGEIKNNTPPPKIIRWFPTSFKERQSSVSVIQWISSDWTASEAKSIVYPGPPSTKNGSLSGFLLMSIHFSQSNGLWRSDWFYLELNNPKPARLKKRGSAVCMLTPLNHPPNVYMIQSFSQRTTTELNSPKVAVHFLSACDEWPRLPGNSEPLSPSFT